MKKLDFKKIIIFALAIIMIFSLAACNKTTNGDDPDDDEGEGNLELALGALVDGLDDLIGEAKELDGAMYASATIFVKSADNIDLEIEVEANITEETPEVKLAINTDGKLLIAFYLQGEVIYITDNLTNAVITAGEGTAKITPATGTDKRSFKFDLTGGIAGVEIGQEVAKLPGIIAGALEDIGSLRTTPLIGDIDLDAVISMADMFDGLLFETTKTSKGYDLKLDVNGIADLLGPEGIGDMAEGFLSEIDNLGEDVAGLIDTAAKLIFGGTLDQLIGKEGTEPIESFPDIVIGIELDGDNLSGVSLSYDYDANEMNLAAGIKNLALNKSTKSTILPSDIAQYDPGAIRIDLGIKGFGIDETLEIFGNPFNDDGGVGAEAFARLAGGGGVAYGRIGSDGEMGALLNFASILEAAGITVDGNTKFYAGDLPQMAVAPENEEGEAPAAGDDDDLDLMGIIGPIFNLLLGDNSLLDAIADFKIDSTELFAILGDAQSILGAVGVLGDDIALDEAGLTELIRDGLDFLATLEATDLPAEPTDADYIAFINDIFGTALAGDDLQDALFADGDANITVEFPDKVFGAIIKINLGETEVLALTLKFGFDMPQTVAQKTFINTFDLESGDVTELDDVGGLSAIGHALLQWLLNAKGE